MDETTGGERRLTAALRALAADDSASGASAAVQVRLFGEVRRLHDARRRSLRKMLMLTAVLSVATAMPVWYVATTTDRTTANMSGRIPAAQEMVTAFYPLVYGSVPMSSARIVRIEVDREVATTLGLDQIESGRSHTANAVLADVLVGDDGLARAVRFVRPVAGTPPKEQQQ